MKLIDSLRFRLAALFRRSRMNAELDDELRSHIAHRADDLERSGLSRAEAERQARIEFGSPVRFKEESKEAAGGSLLESLWQDVRFASRMLRKTPGFTVIAVLTLAMAIGANAVVFGVLNALILRPLDLPDPQSLYAIERTSDKTGYLSYPDYLDLRDRNRGFSTLAAFNISAAAFDTGHNASRAWFYQVTGNYFDALGVQPYLGRFIRPSDENGPNSARYLVLTYSCWHTDFQDDASVVGRVVWLDKQPFTIIGVAPAGFFGTLRFFSPQFFLPIGSQEQGDGRAFLKRSNRWIFETIGHLKPGVAPEQAAADLNAIGSDLQKTYPNDDPDMAFAVAPPTLYGDYGGRPVRAFVAGLMLLVALVLLAACANLGSLFAARAADRSRELALRLALGAGPLRILRQLFTETILISLIGGAFGVCASVTLLRGLSVWQPFSRYPVHVAVLPDAYVYGVALLLALASGLLFGAVPVRQVLRTHPWEIVKSGSVTRVNPRLPLRDVLVVVQIAVCAVLVTSSFVALRGFARSLHSHFGFDPRNAVLVNTDLNMAGYSSERVPDMQTRMIAALEALPGVQAVGLISEPPLRECCNSSAVFADKTADLRASNAAAEALIYDISPGYFHAAATVLLSGRTFTEHDDGNAPRVAIVNRHFAGMVFGQAENAVGAYYKMPDGTRVHVVGIVEDGKYNSLTEDPQPAMFFPIAQSPTSATSLVVRSATADSQQLLSAVKAALRDLDASLPLYIQPWYKELDTALFPSRMATIALGILGAIGAVLSLTGIFGMAAYSVSKRKRELGIRMALGARRKEVLQAALGRTSKLLALGSGAGLVLGILASRVLSSIVFEATPRDPLVLVGAIMAMALLGLLAAWVPAQRALAIDPLVLLREE